MQNLFNLLKHYWVDLFITAVIFIAIGIFGSPLMLFPVAILVIMEIGFSFDNAILNARVLERMNTLWQKLFLTVGMLIAVLGMRFIFPLAIVAVTAQMSFWGVASLSVEDPLAYASKLTDAHHLIAMFGGVYLLLIFLNFFFEDREIRWLKKLEDGLAKLGRTKNLSYIVTGIFIVIASLTLGDDNKLGLLLAGFVSLIIYSVVSLVSKIFEIKDAKSNTQLVRHGWAAFSLFIYLEVQDSAFSFDGVSAAFAITSSVFLIAAGLGIGALFVRSITVHLVKTRQLTRYRYLEHGAHWAIGVLAICLLTGVGNFQISEYVVGLTGVVFIGAAFIQSSVANKKQSLSK